MAGIPDPLIDAADELIRRGKLGVPPRLGMATTPPIVSGSPVQPRLGVNPVATATGTERLGANPSAPSLGQPVEAMPQRPGLQERFQQWEQNEPTAPDPNAHYNVSLPRKLGAIGAGIGGYFLGGGRGALKLGGDVWNAQRNAAERNYEQQEAGWKQEGDVLQKEAEVDKLGQRQPLHVPPGTMVEQPGGGFQQIGTPKEPKATVPKMADVQLTGPDGKPYLAKRDEQGNFLDYTTNQPIHNPQLYQKAPEGGRPVAGSIGNKPAWGIYDQQKGWVDPATKQPLKGFQPPPSWAEVMPATHTISLMDPNTGLPTTYQYNAQTGSYDKAAGVSATGAYGHEMAQAGAVTRAGEQLITDIQANKQRLGTLATWVKKYGLNTPIADPELARLQSELSTFSALQPAMHGFRSKSAMETFDKVIGGLQKNPDATIQSIQGILQTAGQINPALQNRGGAPQAYKVGDTITQNGHSYTVRAVDKNGKVTKAD
jgi:hypothetical protein